MMKYYNEITKKQTIYPYRFKTESELEDEFGMWWDDEISIYYDLTYYFGKDFKHDTNKSNINLTFQYKYIIPYDDDIHVIKDLLKENKEYDVLKNMLKKKTLVYEGMIVKYKNIITNEITDCPYRIKTEKEFIDEFGEDWKSDVSWNSRGHMDYLFGTDLPFDIIYINRIISGYVYNLELTNTNTQTNQDFWCIVKEAIIKNEPNDIKGMFLSTPKLVYERKIIKFNEYKKGD